jgi:glycosyltransferase involved in cell wall biosynthesis
MVKIKIAFDANPLVGQKTGIGQLTLELITALAEDNPEKQFIGHYFNFLNKNKIIDLPIASNISYKKTIYFPTKILNLLRYLNIQLPFEFFCRARTDKIIFPNFVSMPSLFRSKSILFVHDLSYEDFPEYVSEKNGRYLRKWVPRSIKNAESVVTISEFTKKRIIDAYNVSTNKIRVIPVPPRQKVKPDISIINKLQLKDFILFVGTLEPRKNIINLLKSYEMLPLNIQNEQPLVLVGGKGWRDVEILKKIQSMQEAGLSVIQTGYVSDEEKSALYESSKVVLQLSHYEGFGMPVLEAMSYGKPIICSDIPVFHEIADSVAIFVPKDNPVHISQTVLRVITDSKLRKSMSKKSLEHVKNYPKWQDVAISISSLL